MSRHTTMAVSLAAGLMALVAPAAHAGYNLTTDILASIQKHSGKTAFQWRAGKKDWRDISYGEWKSQAEKVAAYLIANGLQPGENVGILNYNNPRWAIIDLGVQLAGGVTVPFYPTLIGPQHNAILEQTDMRFLFVMDQTHLGPISQLEGALDGKTVIGIFDRDRWPHPSGSKLKEVGASEPAADWQDGVVRLESILNGAAASSEATGEMRARYTARGDDDLLTICYTSGTTAPPPEPGQTTVYPGKGVMLSHKNIASNVQAVKSSVAVLESDVFLSVLPLAHMFERTGGYYIAVTSGATIAYADGPPTFIRDVAEVKPTVFACVPLLFERMYNGAFQKASKKLLGKAIGGAKKVSDFFGGNGDRLRGRIVGKFLKRALGGRVRFAVSGGAALKRELAEFFEQNVGITILEGYGLTETAPVLTCNRPDVYQYGTVGVPVPGVEVKLGPDGEILARGPNIMVGYLGMPEKTAEAIDADGWFHTGDLGGWTPEGLLKITGRKKLQFKLKNGEYVSPETVEKAMKHELVAQSMVVGANQDYAAALVFPDLPAMRTRAGMMGIEGSDEELCANETVIGVYMDDVVGKANAQVPKFMRLKRIKLIAKPLSVEAGELTPTLKLKRGVLQVKFADDIAGLFQ